MTDKFNRQPEPNRQTAAHGFNSPEAIAGNRPTTAPPKLTKAVDVAELSKRLDQLETRVKRHGRILIEHMATIDTLETELKIYKDYLERDPLFRVWRRLFKGSGS